MKLFRTGDINIVKSCQSYFSFNLPSVLLKKRAENSILNITRNSSGDEIANVNFLYDDIVHALKIQ